MMKLLALLQFSNSLCRASRQQPWLVSVRMAVDQPGGTPGTRFMPYTVLAGLM